MEAALASRTATKKAPRLKWLKDTSAAAKPALDDDSTQGVAAQQRAAMAAPGGFGGGAAGGVVVKEPVLKSLRGVAAAPVSAGPASRAVMIEVVLNDRLGKKVRVKCNSDDTIGDLKKLAAAQIGTKADKLRIQKWYTVYKDHIRLDDYEIHDGMGLELYYM